MRLSKEPSSGFYLCKTSRNAALFESKQFERKCYPNADVAHMDSILRSPFDSTMTPRVSRLRGDEPSSHRILQDKTPLLRFASQKKNKQEFEKQQSTFLPPNNLQVLSTAENAG